MEEKTDFECALKIRPRLHVPPPTVIFNYKAWAPAQIAGITNGYTYALDLPSAGDANPGRLMEKPINWDSNDIRSKFGKSVSKLEMHRDAVRDGLYYLDNVLPSEGHVMGFFTRDSRANSMPEMLFARRDNNGLWSYRPPVERGGCNGSGLPRQVDFNKQPITDILAADLGPFKKFLGFASIPFSGISYYPRT